MSGTENVGASPPAGGTPSDAPNTEGWNAEMDKALGEMGVSLIGGLMMQMMNSTKANGEEGG